MKQEMSEELTLGRNMYNKQVGKKSPQNKAYDTGKLYLGETLEVGKFNVIGIWISWDQS